MSTRSNIKVTDGYGELLFYRHSDGYPSVALRPLLTFLKWAQEGSIRDNVEQSSEWLILLGAFEQHKLNEQLRTEGFDPTRMSGWKVGQIEPSEGIHGDIEYFYIIRLDTHPKVIECYHAYMDGEVSEKPFAIVNDPRVDPSDVERQENADVEASEKQYRLLQEPKGVNAD